MREGLLLGGVAVLVHVLQYSSESVLILISVSSTTGMMWQQYSKE